MDGEPENDDQTEQVIAMLIDAGLVEAIEREDGCIELSLTERGRQLGQVLPGMVEEGTSPPDDD